MVFGGVYVLWDNPLIVSCGGVNELVTTLNLKRHASVLYSPSSLWRFRTLPSLMLLWLKARSRKKALHFMCNAVEEDRLIRRLGFPGILVSVNCYVNERVFQITAEAKAYDAVYTAQMQPVKRLFLARQVPSLYVITYGDWLREDGTYDLHAFEPSIGHADFNPSWATFDQIVSIYNRSKVGLALSAREGAMLASVEYMLCGLPVVSTPCEGGREVFFDDRYVAVVEPSSAAVAAGVSDMIARDIKPELVREGTLRRLNEHRISLCKYVQRIVRMRDGREPSVEELWGRIFGNENGTMACFVKFEDFKARGLV